MRLSCPFFVLVSIQQRHKATTHYEESQLEKPPVNMAPFIKYWFVLRYKIQYKHHGIRLTRKLKIRRCYRVSTSEKGVQGGPRVWSTLSNRAAPTSRVAIFTSQDVQIQHSGTRGRVNRGGANSEGFDNTLTCGLIASLNRD